MTERHQLFSDDAHVVEFRIVKRNGKSCVTVQQGHPRHRARESTANPMHVRTAELAWARPQRDLVHWRECEVEFRGRNDSRSRGDVTYFGPL